MDTGHCPHYKCPKVLHILLHIWIQTKHKIVYCSYGLHILCGPQGDLAAKLGVHTVNLYYTVSNYKLKDKELTFQASNYFKENIAINSKT